jgi:hypothetical protein
MAHHDNDTSGVLAELIDLVVLLPYDARLALLGRAWLAFAQVARGEALAFPGGFAAARARQLGMLAKMTRHVESDEPDLELQRLLHEGDAQGVTRHMNERRPQGGA